MPGMQYTKKIKNTNNDGFTIVELLIVIVVIAILAAIITVAYNGITQKAAASMVQSDLSTAQAFVERKNVENGEYPSDGDTLPHSEGTKLEYTRTGSGYCLTASSEKARANYYYDKSNAAIQQGVCEGHDGYTGEENGDTGVTAISAGGGQTCVIASGKAYCWGENFNGQLGDGTTTQSSAPVAVTTSGVLADKTVTQISAGGTYTCAIASSNIYCWGRNSSGTLGNGNRTNSPLPVAVRTDGALAGKTVTSIDASNSHTCAVASGQAYCWGQGTGGALGIGDVTGFFPEPVAVDTSGVLAGKTVTSIATGYSHTCAVAGGQVYCWGNNSEGRLGDGTTIASPVPVAVNMSGVLAGKTVSEVTSGGYHTCVLASGLPYCWGSSGSGQLGNNTTASSPVPVEVRMSGVLAGTTITALSAGYSPVCVVASERAYCWGNNGFGQLGNNSVTNARVPVIVNTDDALANKTVTAITAGNSHTCVIADSQPYCWGYNSTGQLGEGTLTNSRVPVTVLPLPV